VTDKETVKLDPREFAHELGPAADAKIGPFIGVASIALNMAMKYHDISTVQDGALYQQYKLEGKNMTALHIDHVFETAIQIEEHLIRANKRVAAVMLSSLVEMDEAEDPAESSPSSPPVTTEGE
jgi:hypothetical protein